MCKNSGLLYTFKSAAHKKNDCDCYDFVYCFVRCDALFYGRVRTGYDMLGGDFVFVGTDTLHTVNSAE